MKNQRNLSQSILFVALATVILLFVPLVAMQFTDEVVWSLADFIVAGALLFGTGLSFVLLIRLMTNIVYRFAVGFALGTTFFMIWANLAVGLIGGGPNPGNLMYIGVVAVIILGIYLSRFKAAGMGRAMFATALALLILAAIALLANMQDYPGSSMMEIIGVNAFFATLFGVSGLLFRYVAMESQQIEESKG